MYNTNAGEHRCHAHRHRDDRDEDLLLLPPGCSTELPLPLPLVAWTANLLDATGQGIVGINGQDWNATAAVELLVAITSSPSTTIFRDVTRLLQHLALFRRRPVPPPPLSSLLLGSTVHLTSLNMTSPPLPAAAPSFFRSSSFIGGRLCSLRLLVNSFRLHWHLLLHTYTNTHTHKHRHLHKTKS